MVTEGVERYLAAVVLVIGFGLTVMVFDPIDKDRTEDKYLPSLSDEWQIILDPNVEDPDISESEAMSILADHPINDGRFSSLNNSDTYNMILYRDNDLDRIYWDIDDLNVHAWVDAYTGEIVYYSDWRWNDGDVGKEEALHIASDLANVLPIPDSYRVEYYLEVDEYGLDDVERTHCINYTRTHLGYDVAEGCMFKIDRSGKVLYFISKETLYLPVSVSIQTDWAYACQICVDHMESLNEDINISMIWKTEDYATPVFVGPNHFWDENREVYGDYRGTLCWVVRLFCSTGDYPWGWDTFYMVDVSTGRIVGGALNYYL